MTTQLERFITALPYASVVDPIHRPMLLLALSILRKNQRRASGFDCFPGGVVLLSPSGSHPCPAIEGNSMAQALDLTDRKLLNILQSAFPLAEDPFTEIGRQLDLTEPDVIDRIRRLKESNVVRQISAIFDTRRLGYKTVLVAMRFREDKLDSGARAINKHPGVSTITRVQGLSTCGLLWPCRPTKA